MGSVNRHGQQSAPPIFIQTEDGLVAIDVPHFPVAKTLDEFFGYMDMLINQSHEYKTVVIDTADWLEKLIWKTVCDENKVTSIEKLDMVKDTFSPCSTGKSF